MGWESRGRSGKLYFYAAERGADGRVVKTYLGVGPEAERAAAVLADRRRADARDRAAVLSAAALLAAGCHRPNNGPWRKRRGEADRPPAPGQDGRD